MKKTGADGEDLTNADAEVRGSSGLNADGDSGLKSGDDSSLKFNAQSATDGFNLFRQPWLVVACILLAAAAVLLFLSRTNAAFVVAALGVSAWFWNVRGNLIRQHGLEKRGRRDWRPRGDEEE
jgi:hypothetical protein